MKQKTYSILLTFFSPILGLSLSGALSSSLTSFWEGLCGTLHRSIHGWGTTVPCPVCLSWLQTAKQLKGDSTVDPKGGRLTPHSSLHRLHSELFINLQSFCSVLGSDTWMSHSVFLSHIMASSEWGPESSTEIPMTTLWWPDELKSGRRCWRDGSVAVILSVVHLT